MASARTPDELETLLEDAFVLSDADAVADLFSGDGVLVADRLGRGRAEITGLSARLCRLGRGYVAEPRRVIEGPDCALIIGDRAISVARLGPDRCWRYMICLLLE